MPDTDIKLVPVICTQCGAKMVVESGKDAAICEYCGTPFVVEKAIEKYRTNIENLVVNQNIHIEIHQGTQNAKNKDYREYLDEKARRIKKEQEEIAAIDAETAAIEAENEQIRRNIEKTKVIGVLLFIIPLLLFACATMQ